MDHFEACRKMACGLVKAEYTAMKFVIIPSLLSQTFCIQSFGLLRAYFNWCFLSDHHSFSSYLGKFIVINARDYDCIIRWHFLVDKTMDYNDLLTNISDVKL